jgi:hypothetical protein
LAAAGLLRLWRLLLGTELSFSAFSWQRKGVVARSDMGFDFYSGKSLE